MKNKEKTKREFMGKTEIIFCDKKEIENLDKIKYERNWNKKALKAYLKGWEYFDFGYSVDKGFFKEKMYFKTPMRLTSV